MPASQTLILECNGTPLAASYHAAEPPDGPRLPGVVMVSGGLQTRFGSHRNYFQLANAMAHGGFAVLRFDRRGTGDSEGQDPGFLNSQLDIQCAVNALTDRHSTTAVVGFGLCDGATAAAFSAAEDSRFAGLILLNPWVIEPHATEHQHLTHHYRRRFRNPTSLMRLLKGEIAISQALRSLARMGTLLMQGPSPDSHTTLADQLRDALERTNIPVLILLSDHDDTASSFEAVSRDSKWQDLLKRDRFTIKRLTLADHTLSTPGAQEQAHAFCTAWLHDQFQKEN